MRKKFLLTITHSTDDLERANAAVALAVSLLAEGADLAIFFIFQGALLAQKGVAETIHGQNLAPVKDLWPDVIGAQIPMYLCGACAKTYRITEEKMISGVKIVQLPTIAAEMMDRETITI